MMTRAFAILTVLATTSLVFSNLYDLGLVRAASKITASTGFVAVALSVGAHRWRFGRVMLVGLIFSWLGDFFLLGTGERSFLYGLVSFLTAHVVYCIAFGIRGVNLRWAAAAVPLVAAMTAIVLWWLSPYVDGSMKWPVRAYTIVISVMVALSIGVRGAGGPWAIPIGAILFYLSDISVASGQFVRPAFPNYLWGLPLYFMGQLFLASSTRKEVSLE